MIESNPQYEKFTKVMNGLMAVSYKELQQALKKDKKQKARKKRTRRTASRASGGSS